MLQITFQPSGLVVSAPKGSNIRDASLKAGLSLPSTCGGVGSCGLCKVVISGGAENLNSLTPPELDKLGNVFFITKERLACQVQVMGDLECTIPDDTADKARRIEKSRALAQQRREQRAHRETGPGHRGTHRPPGRR